jgi:hypothetical protein
MIFDKGVYFDLKKKKLSPQSPKGPKSDWKALKVHFFKEGLITKQDVMRLSTKSSRSSKPSRTSSNAGHSDCCGGYPWTVL